MSYALVITYTQTFMTLDYNKQIQIVAWKKLKMTLKQIQCQHNTDNEIQQMTLDFEAWPPRFPVAICMKHWHGLVHCKQFCAHLKT